MMLQLRNYNGLQWRVLLSAFTPIGLLVLCNSAVCCCI